MTPDIIEALVRQLRARGCEADADLIEALQARVTEQAGEIERLKRAAEYAESSKQAGIEAAVFDAVNGTPCEQIRWQQERDALQARVRELEMFRHQHRDCDTMGVELQQLRAENEGLRKDAERYRWIKSLRNRQLTWDSDNIVWVGKENLGDLDEIADIHITAMSAGQYAMTDSCDSPQEPLV